MDEKKVANDLEAGYFHDWTSDPFSQGAYSYVTAGFAKAQQELSEPVENTIFFAGEATDLNAQLGTVHGAISSGKRVARQVLRSISQADSQSGSRIHHTHPA